MRQNKEIERRTFRDRTGEAMGGDFDDVFLPAEDGLSLHARLYPAGGGAGSTAGAAPAVCLAGLTRNARDFHDLALFLSREAARPRRVVAIDSRGRGESAHDPEPANYTVPVEARDVVTVLNALGIGQAHFVGTSRGGLILHLLAAAIPGRLASVVLNDVGPELGAAGLEQIKGYLSSDRAAPQSFAQALAAQRAVHGAAFPALGDDDWARMTAAIYRDEDGRPVADFDPAIAAAFASLDLAQPLATLWPQFDAFAGIPLMAVRGETSLLLTRETFSEMRRRRPDMAAIEVAGQGHPPMLETAGLPQRIAAFMAEADSRTPL
jgi:pimeloyl-ACP methyl ester carboxylesterase